MIRLGAYKKGTDPEIDLSIGYYSKLEEFLNQRPEESCPMQETYQKLEEILNIEAE